MKNIKSELELIIKYIDECLEEYPLTKSEDFYTRRLAFKSVALDLIQVGEHANRVPKGFQSDHADIPWSLIIGFRNIAVHSYDGLDENLVYEIIEKDVPKLREQIYPLLFISLA
ncbi:DUF86 domain-containing protein [Candidatus Symbiothrix dinenymphae]|uniref:HepT-like ribonuclease domain-containing protein n=1 Tax=Candidatus Symbiothrix dinenymphae TaxID=467085 RepID=UPI0006C06EF5|nr:HepT-like ribonuclease domain-containing protein [Candidatus Symbiothrix dinenymphae]GAP71247.1 hypothetical protein SAMD00024442_1_66 [Candidatus Symbiothrix dinenymphae]